jgi:hypothetical protein
MANEPEDVDDPMLAPVAEHWESIVAGYKQFEDKRPVVGAGWETPSFSGSRPPSPLLQLSPSKARISGTFPSLSTCMVSLRRV